MLVRRLVSGVRNSCPASAISRCCRSREEARDRSIRLNASASRVMSSLPLTAIGVRSSVRVTCSTAAASSRTGRRLERATALPAMAASTTPVSAEDDQDQPE